MIKTNIMNQHNKYFPLIISCFVNVLILIFALIFFRFVYYENDDQAMNYIAAGAYGSNSEYLVFMNIILGYFLKLLYSISFKIN